MKRLLLSTVTLFLMLVPASAVGAGTGSLEALSVTELAAVTAGICSTCAPKDEPPPPPPYVVSLDWDIVSQSESSHKQVRYSLEETFINSSSRPYGVTRSYRNNCRHVLVSGGFGVSQGLNVQVGTVYDCSSNTTLQLTVPAYRRLKLYRAEMRYYIDYVAKEFMVWSDGYREATGHVNRGTEERRYSAFHPVIASL